MIYVNNLDKPGFIGRLGSLLAEEQHQHCATFNLGRLEAGDRTPSPWSASTRPCQRPCVEKIKATANVKEVRALAFLNLSEVRSGA